MQVGVQLFDPVVFLWERAPLPTGEKAG